MPMLPKELRGASHGGGHVPLARPARRGSLFPSAATQVDQSDRAACATSRQGSFRWAQVTQASEVSRSVAGSTFATGSDAWSVTGKSSDHGSADLDSSRSQGSDNSADCGSPAGGANTVDVFGRLASVADAQRMRLVDIFRMVWSSSVDITLLW